MSLRHSRHVSHSWLAPLLTLCVITMSPTPHMRAHTPHIHAKVSPEGVKVKSKIVSHRLVRLHHLTSLANLFHVHGLPNHLHLCM
jgi:hypothetical protein